MSDLDDQLRAQGGACEHLAKMFAHKRGMAESGLPCLPLSTTPWADALKQLLARIAELEAHAEHDEDNLEGMEGILLRANQRHTVELLDRNAVAEAYAVGEAYENEVILRLKAEAAIGRLRAITPEQLAEKFHATYEGAAEAMGYQTRPESAAPWDHVPAQNRALMVATCAEVLADLRARAEKP